MAKGNNYKNPQYGLRIPAEKMNKLKYIAERNIRSANQEIEFVITNHIEAYEKEHGTIILDPDDSDS